MKIDPIARIHIKEAKFHVLIGTRPEERLSTQELLADISFDYDSSLAAQTDALGHAVDYAVIHTRILEKISVTKFFLLERLAAIILEIIMEDPRIIRSSLILEKKAVLPGSKAVAISMSASRTGAGNIKTNRCY
jgi:FolB domain-containing protein